LSPVIKYRNYRKSLYVLNAIYTSVFPNLDHIRPSVSLKDQRQAAQDLIGRVLGQRSSSFQVVIVGNTDPEFKDTFNVSSISA
jgi:hypothetical protein